MESEPAAPRRRATRAPARPRASTRAAPTETETSAVEAPPPGDAGPPARGRRTPTRAAAPTPAPTRGRRPAAALPAPEPGATVADAATEAVIAAALQQKAPRGRQPRTAGREAVAEPQAETPETPQPPAPVPPRERFGRGRGRGRRDGIQAEPVDQVPAPAEAPPEPQPPYQGRPRGGRGRGGDRGRRDVRLPGLRPEPPAAPSREGRGGGSVESLIARQNVLFEEFAGQQQQTLREIQRSLASGRGGGASNAVAPIVLPRVGVFLDVPNLVFAADDSGVRIHFGKLLEYLTQGRQLVRATAYAPITDDPMTRFENQRFVHPVLGQGYKVVTKPWKRFADGGMKANFDIELAVDILTMSDRLDIVVLLSGDSDFKRVIELVESKGVRVEVCAFAQSTASELRAVADQYIDIGSILQYVAP